jgi:hypothetical protein
MSIISYFVLLLFPVDQSLILHICVLSILNSFVSINTSVLIGKEKIRSSNLISLIQPVILIISLMIFFTLKDKPGAMEYIYGLYFSFGLTTLVSFVYYIKFCGGIYLYHVSEYRKIAIDMVRFGILNQVAHITQMLSFRLSYYILDH